MDLCNSLENIALLFLLIVLKRLMKLKLLWVNYITYICIHNERGFMPWPKTTFLQKVAKPIKVTEDKIDIVFLNFKL